MDADNSQCVQSNSCNNPAATVLVIFLITLLLSWMPNSGLCILSRLGRHCPPVHRTQTALGLLTPRSPSSRRLGRIMGWLRVSLSSVSATPDPLGSVLGIRPSRPGRWVWMCHRDPSAKCSLESRRVQSPLEEPLPFSELWSETHNNQTLH